jgi:hypothetical protein
MGELHSAQPRNYCGVGKQVKCQYENAPIIRASYDNNGFRLHESYMRNPCGAFRFSAVHGAANEVHLTLNTQRGPLTAIPTSDSIFLVFLKADDVAEYYKATFTWNNDGESGRRDLCSMKLTSLFSSLSIRSLSDTSHPCSIVWR